MNDFYIVIRCTRSCDWGHRGMDNCNTCGCTGLMFYHRASKQVYENTRKGWVQTRKEHPDVPADETDLVVADANGTQA